MIMVNGSSIESLMPSGDRILVDTSQCVPLPTGNFVIRDGIGLVAKRVEHLPHWEPPMVFIKSGNTEYQTYDREGEELKIIGCATWAGKAAVMKAAGLAFWLAVTMSFPAAGQTVIRGVATVIDGDTIEIRGTRIRLHGIDAPEGDQICTRARRAVWHCGDEATMALTRHLGRSQVRCKTQEEDRFGRTIAVCFKGAGDINHWMVANGWAVAFRRFSLEYVAAEERAQKAKLGLWTGTFDMPWDWRAGKRGR